jgi:hypothetical protein
MTTKNSLWVYKVEIEAVWLSKLSVDEQSLLLLAGHFANEIAALIKLFAWCNNHHVQTELEQAAKNSQSLLLSRILTGKLLEGWELLRVGFFGTRVSSTYHERLDDPGRAALSRLKTYFNGPNAIRSIRVGHAFHYDFNAFKIAWESADRDEKLVFYLAHSYLNSFFQASDTIAMKSLLASVPSIDSAEAMERWIQDSTDIAGVFLEFISSLMFVGMQRMLPDDFNVLNSPQIEISDAPSADEIAIPYFAHVLDRDKRI